MLEYLGQFNTNYIIFRNIEIFKERFFSEIKIKKYDEIFGNISFVILEYSKLINYSTNVCPNDQGTTTINKIIMR
jgi:hypothetical protein